VVGSYRIVEKLGEGGMGAVYRAVDEMLEREVAIKAIRPDLAREPQIVERFRAEAKILARVSHPAIAGIYSFFLDGGELFLAMELVRGRTLSEVIEAGGALPWQRVVPLLSTALEGIEQAHRAGIIHRDLKPDNLMLTEADTLKVMDFGIARMAGSSHLTRTGLLVGTLRYIAPEQIRGEEVDRRTDLYALGAVFYQMLTGRVPFDGTTEFAILKAQLDDAPVPPASLVPGLPEWVDRAVLKALEKDPSARFQSVEELRLFLSRQGTAVPETGEDTLILPPRAHKAETVAATPSAPTVETDRTRFSPPPPSQPTNVAPPAPVPSTSYRPVEGAGWKRGAMAAALVLALIALGAFLWTRRGPAEPTPLSAAPVLVAPVSGTETPVQTPPPGPAEPEPTLTGASSATLTAASAPLKTASQPPRPAPAPPSKETPKPVSPPPSRPEPEAAPAISREEPAKAPEKAAPAETEPESEPAPSVPTTGELPFEELRRVSAEMVAATEKLGVAYGEFLEKKEDDGGEITEVDEQLQTELESLTEAVDRLSKRFGEGFFTRGRLRNPQNRVEIARRLQTVADSARQVERLMAQVQPGPEVRQSLQDVRRRWVRIGEIFRGR
jgi:serine/threonine-protein kinase